MWVALVPLSHARAIFYMDVVFCRRLCYLFRYDKYNDVVIIGDCVSYWDLKFVCFYPNITWA